ncbi:MAG: efflux RND transporter periplasmic adaptor subunit, partial [Anaerolineae bacterium]
RKPGVDMKTARYGALALILLAVAAGGFFFIRSRTLPPSPTGGEGGAASSGYTQIVDVQVGNLSASLSVVGQVEAEQQADLTFTRLDGTTKLLTLAVAAGHTVTAGQVLATIDPAAYQQALDQAKSSLQAAEETLADLQTPVTDLARAQADLAVAQANLQNQTAQDTLTDLLHPDIASLTLKVTDAQRTLNEAQASLASLQSDRTAATRLDKLRETEATAAAEHARLAAETYNDTFHQDRLRVAFNTMMNARDARITAELQQQADLLKAQSQLRKAQTSLADAQEVLAEAQAGGDKLTLAKARLAVQQAQVAQAEAQENRSQLDEGPDTVKLATAQADLDKKRLAVTDAEAALAATQIMAPFAGTILQTHVEPGDLVTANTRILTVANLQTLQIVAAVDETTIRQIAAGQAAQVTFDAFLGRTLRGQVASVPLQGTLQGDVMVYSVPITLTGAVDLPLLVGMTANVKVELGQATNALLVPTMALQRSGGLVQVLVPNPNDPSAEPQAVPVEIGLSDGINTQIVRGLNPGDKVVVQIAATQSTNPFNFRGVGGDAPRIQPIGR